MYRKKNATYHPYLKYHSILKKDTRNTWRQKTPSEENSLVEDGDHFGQACHGVAAAIVFAIALEASALLGAFTEGSAIAQNEACAFGQLLDSKP